MVLTFLPTTGIAQEEQFPRLFVVSSSDTAAQEIPLKATRQGGDISKVSGFTIDFNNVVQVPQGQTLVIFNDGSVQGFAVTKAKLVNEQKQTIDLIQATNQRNSFSLNGMLPGVYTLNVLGTLGDIEGGYETVLVIVRPDQPTTVINQMTKNVVEKRISELLLIDIFIEIIFEDEELPPCDPNLNPGELCEEEPEPGPCQPGEYCPLCPPGVETDYCADDDELNDTDECILNPELCVDIPPTLVAEDEDETVEDETEEEGNANPPVNFGPDGPVDEDESSDEDSSDDGNSESGGEDEGDEGGGNGDSDNDPVD